MNDYLIMIILPSATIIYETVVSISALSVVSVVSVDQPLAKFSPSRYHDPPPKSRQDTTKQGTGYHLLRRFDGSCFRTTLT